MTKYNIFKGVLMEHEVGVAQICPCKLKMFQPEKYSMLKYGHKKKHFRSPHLMCTATRVSKGRHGWQKHKLAEIPQRQNSHSVLI